MATPPFNIAQTSPAPTDLVSSFPADEQSNRDIIESWLTILSDPATGKLRDTAFTLPLTLTQAAAGNILTLVSTDAGANTGPTMNLYRNSASPAVNDSLGQLQFDGEDSAGNQQVYGAINVAINDPTSTSEDSKMRFFVDKAGALTETFTIDEVGVDFVGILTGDVISLGSGAQTDANFRNRQTGNNYEFGHVNPAGFGSTIGAYVGSGFPFLAFNGEAGTTSNTFRTRGNRASILRSDLGGGWIFENVANANSDNQVPTTQTQITNTGVLLVTAGAAASPTISTLTDTNTGIYWSSADVLSFTTGGVARASFTTTALLANIDLTTSANVNAAAGTFSGTVTAALFSGSGASLTALNASNLSSGTVPSARISGSYTSLTGTGALSAGSIVSTFGSINVGSSAISGGAISGSTVSSTGQFLAGAGVGVYSFTADTNTGMDNFAADNIGLNAGGVRRLTVNSTGIVINGAVDASGTVSGGTVESTAVFQVASAGTLTLRPNPGSATGQMTLATDGDIVGQGTFTGDDFIIPSDKRLKKDITALSKSPHYIEPVEYTLKKTNERHVGFLADDFVGLPGAAIRDDNGILQLAPMAILAYLWDRVNRLEANL